MSEPIECKGCIYNQGNCTLGLFPRDGFECPEKALANNYEKCDRCGEVFDILNEDTLYGCLDDGTECSPFMDLDKLCAKCLKAAGYES